jgi:hypothetical protein
VFVRSGNAWSEQAELTASDGGAFDGFGDSVAISGDSVVVGAYGKDSTTGAAYVFVRSGTTWSQEAELLASDRLGGDSFGYSAAISGDTVVIGAFGKNVSGSTAAPTRSNNLTGAAYVFVRSGSVWSQQAILRASDASPYDRFGWSVAISGSTVIAGAYSAGRQSTGAAYVFVRSGTTWTQQAELIDGDARSLDQLGYAVGVSGSTAVVGAPGKHPEGHQYTGAAYVFVRSGTDWSQRAKLVSSDGAGGDLFGRSVAVSRFTSLVGALAKDDDTGATYVFVP